jgi:hypothetical protein
MLLKTKDRIWRVGAEAGMSLITHEIIAESGNVIENKGDDRFLKLEAHGPREYDPFRVGEQSSRFPGALLPATILCPCRARKTTLRSYPAAPVSEITDSLFRP